MRKDRGFTLLEVLIALAVFAVIATLTSSAMYYAFNTRARLTEQADRLNSLQLSLSLLSRDTAQAIDRGIYGTDMRSFPIFTGEPDYIEFTRGGYTNPNSSEKRSTLKRVAILCQNNQLIHRSWDVLDTTDRNRYEDRILQDNLLECRFAFLDHNLQVLKEWRPQAVRQNQQQEPLPKAIQLNINLKSWGKLSLLFPISKAVYVDK